MHAMKPFFDTIYAFEGFEFVAFWLGLFIFTMGAGFALDNMMQKQGFGPMLNGIYTLLGAFIGVYLRYNFFLHAPWPAYEPFVTASLCFGSIVILLIGLAFLRNRFWS